MSKKRQLGQYYTTNFDLMLYYLAEFSHFFTKDVFFTYDASTVNIIDPFAGDGSLLRLVVNKIKNHFDDVNNLRINAVGCDIDKSLCEQYGWTHIDSITSTDTEIETAANVNQHFVCVTNPPYLGKSSAKRLGIKDVSKYFKQFDDLYLEALYKCYNYYNAGLMIVPESFISYLLNTETTNNNLNNNLILSGITNIVSLYENPFNDTNVPVCVIIWDHRAARFMLNNYKILNTNAIVTIDTIPDACTRMIDLVKIRRQYTDNTDIDSIKQNIKFNDPNGSIGLVAYDSYIANKKPIQFCSIDKLPFDKNTVSKESRMNTIISIPAIYNDLVPNIIDFSNYILNDIIRKQTYDLVLTPFKCNNTNGIRRRRLDYNLAKSIIATAIYELTPH